MYLNLIQLAESFGVSERTIEEWVRKEGLPATADRQRLIFDRGQVAQWAAERGLATKAGFLLASDSALPLAPLLERGGIWRGIPPSGMPDPFSEAIRCLPGISPAVSDMLAARIRTPRGLALAPIGGGWALPHPATRVSLGRDAGVIALVLLSEPLPPAENAADQIPVRHLLFFIAPSARTHLDCLARLTRLVAEGTLESPADKSDSEIIAAVAARDPSNPGKSGPLPGTPRK
jgi:nitrogen PTS system EIIA component